LTKPAKTLTIC